LYPASHSQTIPPLLRAKLEMKGTTRILSIHKNGSEKEKENQKRAKRAKSIKKWIQLKKHFSYYQYKSKYAIGS
jgi:hypothetical protein